jgi:hypothetical protein
MATKANLVIDQGATYSVSLDITDDEEQVINLTGYTGAAQIRKHYTSSNSVSFTVGIAAADGTVQLSLTANQTSSMIAGRYVYDVELTNSSGIISRVVEGIVTVTPQSTR